MSTAVHGGAVVAVAVSGGRSQRALRWAAENLIPHASRVLLVHVIPPLSPDLAASPASSPPAPATPLFSSLTSYLSLNSGNSSAHDSEDGEGGGEAAASGESRREAAAAGRRERTRAALEPFRAICRTDKEVEIEVLEAEDVAGAILDFATGNGVKSLVLGCASLSWLNRIIKSQDVPNAILESAPGTCNIFLVSRRKIILKLVSDSITGGFSPTLHIRKIKSGLLTEGERGICTPRSRSLPTGSTYQPPHDRRRIDSLASNDGGIFNDSFENNDLALVLPTMWDEQDNNNDSFNSVHPDIQRSQTHSLVFPDINAAAGQSTSEAASKVQRLRVKLQYARSIYDQRCKQLASLRLEVESISSKHSDREMKLSEAMQREEEARRIADEEKARRIEAEKEVDDAKKLLVKEALDRHIAEINSIKESSEKRKTMDALFTDENICRSYSSFEVEFATNNFSEALKIGEGGYGNVYKCYLDQIPVAIKVLRNYMIEKTTNEQFLREVEVLTRIRHPHVVLLLGVCVENKCLIYEYMENGSLDDRLFRKDGTKALPWATRFRILFEVACTLAFLHGSKPDAVIHCDLKPGNILLDGNYVSKISDVGLARMIPDIVPDDLTAYKETDITGTPHYIDPEYHRTGTLRPKSDLYAFGIIALQMLTGRHPSGLVGDAENALRDGTLATMLDDSVKGWPLEESEKLAQIALKCTALRCRDRPDLESEVIPVLEEILTSVDVWLKKKELETIAPSQYYCPILKEVMSDPYIAADGFTYERVAIESWLARQCVSPMTHLQLPNTCILPNLTMRTAILEWRGQSTLPNVFGDRSIEV